MKMTRWTLRGSRALLGCLPFLVVTQLFGCSDLPGNDTAETTHAFEEDETEEPIVQSVPDPDGECVRLLRVSDSRYLDAYTDGNGDVVTRPYQGNNSQLWCFARVQSNYYEIQHRTFSGEFLDAFTSSADDYKAVLRAEQNNYSQQWRLTSDSGFARLRQRSPARYLDAYSSSSYDYRAVTRGSQSDMTQHWKVLRELSTPANVRADESGALCRATDVAFDVVAGAAYYHLYRDGVLVQEQPADGFTPGLSRVNFLDSGIDPASGTAYSYRVAASSVSLPIGSTPPAADLGYSALSSSVWRIATAAQCNFSRLLERIAVLPLYPADVAVGSAGTISEADLRDLFESTTEPSLRAFFLENSNGTYAPSFYLLAPGSLPQNAASYAATHLRSGNADISAARTAAIAANPSLPLSAPSTRFVNVIMGQSVLGGEQGGSMINVGAGHILQSQGLKSSIGLLAHELGHIVANHAKKVVCDHWRPFGYHPAQGLTDGSCEVSDERGGGSYTDDSNAMGVSARNYSGFTKHVMGWVSSVAVIRTDTEATLPLQYRLYSTKATSVPGSGRKLIKVISNKPPFEVTGGTYWIEFKDETGFNDPDVTGENPIGKRVVVQYHPGITTFPQTYGYLVPEDDVGTWVELEEHSNLQIKVDNVQDTYADVSLWWDWRTD
jgi:hypothetical protein